jgi:CRP-like cAMP-binding protein
MPGADAVVLRPSCHGNQAKAAVRFQILSRQSRRGQDLSKYRKDQIVFSQGDLADAVFYIQKSKVKVTVVSDRENEAVVCPLSTPLQAG